MSTRSGKIEKVMGIARADERRWAIETGRSRKRLDQARQRLGELNAYRLSYSEKASGVGSISAAQWQDFQDFISRLDHAIVAAKQMIVESERDLDQKRVVWTEKRTRLQSLERVHERCLEVEQRDEDRKSQRTLDDLPKRGSPFAE